MNNFRKQISSNTLFRYILTGGVSFFIEIACLLLLIRAGTSPLLAVGISFWIGLVTAFVLQKIITFQNKERRSRHIAWQTSTYILLVLINYLFTLFFVFVMEPLVGVFIARTVALGITVVWNYILYRHVIFNEAAATTTKKMLVNSGKSWKFIVGALLLCVPILVFLSPMYTAGLNTILYGDYDMQVQMTEAARISILEYGQFPLWNPWVSGGVPLYADPQFGLFTPQTFFALLVGSAIAWKLTITFYFIVGFFSMMLLLTYLTDRSKTSAVYNILLAYTWIFGSFFVLRSTGHFTFLLLTLAPLAIYLYLNLTNGRRYVVLLSLLIAFLFNAALHYSSILILLILLVMTVLDICWQVLFNSTNRSFKVRLIELLISTPVLRARNLMVAIVLGLVLVLPRIYLSLEYLRDNSVDRSTVREAFVGLEFGLNALIKPLGTYQTPPQVQFSAFEASSFIGPIALTLFAIGWLIILILLVVKRYHIYKNNVFRHLLTFTALALIAFIVGLAGKPFELLRELPVMSSMRVSTRYFFISSLGIIVATSLLLYATRSTFWRRGNKYITPTLAALLMTSAVHVAYTDYTTYFRPNWSPNPSLIDLSEPQPIESRPPKSEAYWNFKAPHYYALTQATQNSRSQLVADNALVDTRVIPTFRCDEDDKLNYCAFVMSKNARVVSWSPNLFKIERTGPGEIRLNMNQASHWKVNGEYVSADQKTVESASTFSIANSSHNIYSVNYRPLPGFLK